MPEPDLFRINQNALDAEWVNFPRAYHAAAMDLATAREAHDRAKAAMDLACAETDLRVRRDGPMKHGLEKFTETIVENLTITDKRTKDAQEALIVAGHAVDVAKAVVEAMDAKKYGLQDMVKLALANYFSQPVEPEGYREKAKDNKRDAAFGTRKRQ